MVKSYLDINAEALKKIAETEGKDSPKYRSVVRFLECQDIYRDRLEKTGNKGFAQQAAAWHWNKWANEMLARRKDLEEAEQWTKEAVTDFSGLCLIPSKSEAKENESKQTCNIRIKCKVLDFTKFILPGFAIFNKTYFAGDARFYKAHFTGIAWFEKAHFEGITQFSGVNFERAAKFTSAHFVGVADLINANFKGHVWFDNVHFESEARFNDVNFKGHAWFERTRFKWYSIFHFALFKRSVSFNNTIFYAYSVFNSIESRRAFSLNGAQFKVVPDFNEASFHAPPVLDNVEIAEHLTARKGIFRSIEKPKENPREISRNFRALGKMAHEARDWLNEMEFFAQEIRSRRFGLDFPTGKNMGRFWFGLFYEKFSNFGRSFWRPAAHWLALTLVFFPLLYLLLATSAGSWQLLGWFLFMLASLGTIYFWASRERKWFMRKSIRWLLRRMRKPAVRWIYPLIRPVSALFTLSIIWLIYVILFLPAKFSSVLACNWSDALMLSLRQGLVISGLTRNGHLMTTLKNLYGAGGNGAVELSHGVAAGMMLQTVLSAVCFFFLFLALRNHFRIR